MIKIYKRNLESKEQKEACGFSQKLSNYRESGDISVKNTIRAKHVRSYFRDENYDMKSHYISEIGGYIFVICLIIMLFAAWMVYIGCCIDPCCCCRRRKSDTYCCLRVLLYVAVGLYGLSMIFCITCIPLT